MYKNKDWMIEQLKTKTPQEIIKEYKIAETTFYRWIKKHGIELPKKPKKEKPKKEKPLYQNKEWLIQMLADHKNAMGIARVSGYNEYTINQWIRKFDLKNEYDNQKHYLLDENYFEIIDTEHKAYWLGFLMADGWMRIDQNVFGICLKSSDAYMIESFCNDINYNGKIKNTDKDSRVNICSKKLCKDLINLHITPRKTGCEVLPEQIPEELVHHFIRGFFDGDGSVPDIKCFTFFLCSASYNILEDINDVFIKNLEVSAPIRRRSDKDKRFYNYSLYSKNAETVFNWIYSDATIFLQRKYDVYLKYIRSLY